MEQEAMVQGDEFVGTPAVETQPAVFADVEGSFVAIAQRSARLQFYRWETEFRSQQLGLDLALAFDRQMSQVASPALGEPGTLGFLPPRRGSEYGERFGQGITPPAFHHDDGQQVARGSEGSHDHETVDVAEAQSAVDDSFDLEFEPNSLDKFFVQDHDARTS